MWIYWVINLLRKINFPIFSDSKRSKGYAHITFDSQLALNKSLRLNKKYIGKRYIEVNIATPENLILFKSNLKLIQDEPK